MVLSTLPAHANIGKLLLNAWSAEFALRTKLVDADREYLNASLYWVFPQAYFTLLFSARAILEIDGMPTANPQEIERYINQWVSAGMYGQHATANPFTDVLRYRPFARREVPPYPRLNGPEAAALHVKLIEKLHAVGIIHETYILDRLGSDAYRAIIEELPDYLKNGFVGARATLLLSDD